MSFFSSYNNNKNYEKNRILFLFYPKRKGSFLCSGGHPSVHPASGKRKGRPGTVSLLLSVSIAGSRQRDTYLCLSLSLSFCPWSKTTTHQGQHGPPIGCVRDEPTESSRPQRRRRRRRRIRRETSLVSISPKREMAFFFCLNASATPRPKHGRVVIFRHQLQREEEEEENGQR